VTVNNVAPVVNAGADVTLQVGDSFSRPQGWFFDQGTLDTHTVTINWGDGPSQPVSVITDSNNATDTESLGYFGPYGHTYAAAGTYTVTVSVTDNDGGVGTDTFVVNVVSGMTAVDDSYAVAKNGTLTVAAPGVLGNDANYPAGATAQVVRTPSFGTLTFNPDGSFTYKPRNGFTGTDSFRYWIISGTGNTQTQSNIATVTITVGGSSSSQTALAGSTTLLASSSTTATTGISSSTALSPDAVDQAINDLVVIAPVSDTTLDPLATSLLGSAKKPSGTLLN
jgi:hypothetical protein